MAKKVLKMPNMTAEDMDMEFSQDEMTPRKPCMNRIKNGRYIGDAFERKIKAKKPQFRSL